MNASSMPQESEVMHEALNDLLPDALAERTKDILQAVERRLRAHRIDEAINRREHLDIIKALLNEHRSDVMSDVAALMATKTEKETPCPS